VTVFEAAALNVTVLCVTVLCVTVLCVTVLRVTVLCVTVLRVTALQERGEGPWKQNLQFQEGGGAVRVIGVRRVNAANIEKVRDQPLPSGEGTRF